jgi:hypothetical protein
MLSDSQIAARLNATPVPMPPAGLLADLKRDLHFIRTPPPPTRQRQPFGWATLRWPLTGLAGALCWALLMSLSPFGGARSFAAAGDVLRKVRNLHVIHHERAGPPQAVQRDPARLINAWPNFSTSVHPANPMIRTDMYYETSDQGLPRWLTVRGSERTWNQRNHELYENRQTGERRFRLNSAPPQLETVVAPALDSLQWQFTPSPQTTSAAETESDVPLAGCWAGERRHPGVRLGGHTPEWSTRLWRDEATGWIQRMEWLSNDYLTNSGWWVFQTMQFRPLAETFDRHQLGFEVNASDLRSLGLTRAELSRLSTSAFSVEFTGSTNSMVQILIQETHHHREIIERLPCVVVHDPSDTTEIQLRFTDDLPHSIGVRVNGLNMATTGKALRVRVPPSGKAEASSVN